MSFTGPWPQQAQSSSLFAGALADLVGIVPLLNSSALLYCGAGLLALFLLTPGKDRKTID